ncbi:hypothetical protein Clacol_003927 [Clathrus columnatus]|uniref:Ion transport domain-containing protein n=1 Tax=Clathrus columnatus TaxID=1419009 RepID=A0AAV5AAR3_9AGAM|nr:hypothetical protein Clacol_003927 [Clathrus columnatus]
MAALSITTVVLSLGSGCPPAAFYVLEFIINSAMILEVSIRLVAFGKQFWKSPFNIIDLVLTVFCAITILAITLVGCDTSSKAEELFDTLLLVARNLLQFVRLAAVTRQSGRSIFSRPKPIDLSAAGSRRLDIDIEDDDEWAGNAGYSRLPNGVGLDEESGPGTVVFDADLHRPNQNPWAATRTNNGGDDEDTWARLG